MNVSREQALFELLAEARERGITIHSDAEAEELLDWAAIRDGAHPEKYHAVTLGQDIFVRAAYVSDLRVLREEMIHVEQQRAGIGTDQIIEAEIEARQLMIKNRRRWAFTNREIRAMMKEIRLLNRRLR